ncbi:MAG: hypothetical protein IPO81_26260 [Kouleothrix sp.]|nr:hypothetical protein [Kouleothrix sp.]
MQHYLQQISVTRDIVQPPSWLVEHAATCAACRGALALLAAELIAPLPSPFSIACAACQEGLAAYIDRELDENVAAALQAAPAVGWHLWICPDCAELYQLTRALAEATRAGTLGPLPIVTTAPLSVGRLLHALRLSRSFLAYALPRPVPAIGFARGNTPGSTILVADEHAGHRINLSVEQQPDDAWQIMVAVVPPIEGSLVLSLGERTFRVPFDVHGQAIVRDVPDALLSAADGPELAVGIELDAPNRGP